MKRIHSTIIVLAVLAAASGVASAQTIVIGPPPGGSGNAGQPIGIILQDVAAGFTAAGNFEFIVSARAGLEPSPFAGNPNSAISGLEPSPFLKLSITSTVSIGDPSGWMPVATAGAKGRGRAALSGGLLAGINDPSGWMPVNITGSVTLTNSRTGEELDTASYSTTATP